MKLYVYSTKPKLLIQLLILISAQTLNFQEPVSYEDFDEEDEEV